MNLQVPFPKLNAEFP